MTRNIHCSAVHLTNNELDILRVIIGPHVFRNLLSLLVYGKSSSMRQEVRTSWDKSWKEVRLSWDKSWHEVRISWDKSWQEVRISWDKSWQ